MAKKKAVIVTQDALTPKATALIVALRSPFKAFAEGFTHLITARGELAPQFMKAFGAWRAETRGTFVQFVHLLDASVPLDRKGYRNNNVYRSADYLRRLSNRPRSARANPKNAAVTPMVALARLVATVMPIVDPSGQILDAFVREMRWSPQQVARLKMLSAREGAIKLAPRTKHTLLQRAA